MSFLAEVCAIGIYERRFKSIDLYEHLLGLYDAKCKW